MGLYLGKEKINNVALVITQNVDSSDDLPLANEDARNIWLAETQSDVQEPVEAVALSAEAPASSTEERIAKLEQELAQLKAKLK